MSSASSDSQRLDKWMWYVRLVKTRTLATQLVTSGKVRVNETRINKPAHKLNVGDVITVMIAHHPRIYKVLAPGQRRGPATEAAELYEDLSPPPPPKKPSADDLPKTEDKQQLYTSGKAPAREKGFGRPTKKDRRAMDKLEGNE